MTKKEMAQIIAGQVKLPQLLVLEAIQMVLDGLVETLATEGRIELRGFGVFEAKKRKARKARNPRNGDSVVVPERIAVKFKQGREVGERLRQLKEDFAKEKERTVR